ncbi:MAG: zinc-ribbon domain-containing protein [Verrucomicrobiales bacterium]|nr:zinc-ribbon domain-containing protein [Verrucomicrobiales bacterium]
MKLIQCPACSNEISPAAEFCPKCGHPNRTGNSPSTMSCYQCDSPATQKCVHCETLSCAVHLESCRANKDRVLLCLACAEKQKKANKAIHLFAFFAFLIVVILLATQSQR